MNKQQFKKKLVELKKQVEKERKDLDLTKFKDAFQICHTGESSDGATYSDMGKLNQAAWIGENSALLILEIKKLRNRRQAMIGALEWAVAVMSTGESPAGCEKACRAAIEFGKAVL